MPGTPPSEQGMGVLNIYFSIYYYNYYRCTFTEQPQLGNNAQDE